MYFITRQLQYLIASNLFPSDRQDWYIAKGYVTSSDPDNLKKPFDAFLTAQRINDADYYNDFKNLNIKQNFVESVLANNSSCLLESIVFVASDSFFIDNKVNTFPAKSKHTVYFTGLGNSYQDCFNDISQCAKKTGSTVHAFNYPGVRAHGGAVKEVKDLINAGISIVNNLVKQGIAIDDIVLQGDSFGAAVAYEVRKQFFEQSGINIRIIMNNTFSSFENAIADAVRDSSWLPNFLNYGIWTVLENTGWNICPGDDYLTDTPYQCHLQHIGDQTLSTSTLAAKIVENQQQESFNDPCPIEYREDRARIKNYNQAKIKESELDRFSEKYGVNKQGQVNSHLANISDLEFDGGLNVYETFINDFWESSQRYISSHPQILTVEKLPLPLLNKKSAKNVRAKSNQGMFQKHSSELESKPNQSEKKILSADFIK